MPSSLANRRRGSRLLWVLTILYGLALANFLWTPHPWWFLGSTGESIDQTLTREVEDYFQHAGVFFLLAGLTWAAQLASRRPSRRWCVAVTLVYAILGEALQAVVPNRFADFADGLANLAGVGIGWGAGLALEALARRWQRSQR